MAISGFVFVGWVFVFVFLSSLVFWVLWLGVEDRTSAGFSGQTSDDQKLLWYSRRLLLKFVLEVPTMYAHGL